MKTGLSSCLLALGLFAARGYGQLATGSPPVPAYYDIPTITYAVINVSGTMATGVNLLQALDDQNNIAFGSYYISDNTYRVYSWVNGTATQVQNLSVAVTTTALPYPYFPYVLNRTSTLLPSIVTSSGKIYGANYFGYDAPGLSQYSQSFSSAGGSVTLIGGDPVDMPPYNYPGLTNSEYSVRSARNTVYAGQITKTDYVSGGDQYLLYTYVKHGADQTYFTNVVNNVYFPGALNASLIVSGVNDNGWFASNSYNTDGVSNAVWNGNTLIDLEFSPVAINNDGLTIGTKAVRSGDTIIDIKGYIGAPAVTPPYSNISMDSLFLQRAPLKQWRPQISWVYPLLVSNRNPTTLNSNILFSALTPTSPSKPSLINRVFTVTLDSSSQLSQLGLLKLPDGVQVANYTDINANGLILARGRLTSTDQTDHTLLLLPFEIRDVKDWEDPNDDVLIEPKNDARDTNIKSVAWIEPHKKKQDENAAYDAGDDPRMPQLEVQFKGLPASVKVQWKFKCKYSRPSGRDLPEDEVIFPADGSFKEVAGDQPWKIHQEYDDKPFFGGDVEITYKIIGANGAEILPEKIDKFRIAGQNPADERCRKYIDKVAADLLPRTTTLMWYANAIAKSETKSEGGEIYYNQFLTNGIKYPRRKLSGETDAAYNNTRWDGGKGKEGVPNWNNDGKGKPGGYGVKQVTGWNNNGNGDVPRAVIWDWKTNVDEGLNELVGHHNRARKWTQTQRTSATEALPSHTVSGVTFNDGTNRTMEDAVAMKNYNGASRRSSPDPDAEPQPKVFFYTSERATDGHYCYWDHGRNKWSLSRYNSWNPPFNYVVRVCDEVQ